METAIDKLYHYMKVPTLQFVKQQIQLVIVSYTDTSKQR
jgi:hypothetical protein